jgi:hypothetical protein
MKETNKPAPQQSVRLVIDVEFNHNMARTLTSQNLKDAAEMAYANYISGDLNIVWGDTEYVEGVLFVYDENPIFGEVEAPLIFLTYKDNALEDAFVGELNVTIKTTDQQVTNEEA